VVPCSTLVWGRATGRRASPVAGRTPEKRSAEVDSCRRVSRSRCVESDDASRTGEWACLTARWMRFQARDTIFPERTPDRASAEPAEGTKCPCYAREMEALQCDRSKSGSKFGWIAAHEALSRLAKSRAALAWEEARCLLAAQRAGVHRHLGFGSFVEYADSSFGYEPRSVQEKLRVAEALERLPELSQALKDGALSWSAVRELTRVAVPQTERDWLKETRGLRMRDIERRVRCHKPGDRPTDAADPSQQRHTLSFDVNAGTFALFREAVGKLRRDTPGPLDEETALMLMARQVLEGPSDAGRSSYQIALHVCEQCRRGSQEARGELVEVGSEIVDMACCDAQHIGRVDSVAEPGDAHVGVANSTQSERTTNDDVAKPRPSRKRATQDIQPAVRREVRRRDGGRCVVPGCRNGTYLDQHHLNLAPKAAIMILTESLRCAGAPSSPASGATGHHRYERFRRPGFSPR
jgi:hypothetical protein